jgi:hypothetical protein
VDVKANTEAAVSQVRKLGSAFDETASDMEKLVDVGHDLGKSNDDIARDLSKINGRPFEEVRREVGKAADAVDDLDDEADDARKSLQKVGDTGRDAGDDTKKGMDKAKAGLEEFGTEGNSTAREVGASFDGSVESIVGGFQELAANAFAGFGPGGAALGLAAAAGIGIGTALFGTAEEKRKALEEKASDLAKAYIQAGTTVLNEMDIASRIGDIATTVDPAEKQNLADLTQALGDRALALRVLAGDSGALATAQEILESRERALGDASFAATNNTGRRKTEIGEESVAVGNLSRILEEQTGIQGSASQSARDYSDALKQVLEDAGTATVQVDEFGNELYTLPSGATVVVDAVTGQAVADVGAFKGDVNSIPGTVVSTVVFRADTSQADAARARLQRDFTVGVNYAPTGQVLWE